MLICGQEEGCSVFLMKGRLIFWIFIYFEWKNLTLKAKVYGDNEEIWVIPRCIG